MRQERRDILNVHSETAGDLLNVHGQVAGVGGDLLNVHGEMANIEGNVHSQAARTRGFTKFYSDTLILKSTITLNVPKNRF